MSRAALEQEGLARDLLRWRELHFGARLSPERSRPPPASTATNSADSRTLQNVTLQLQHERETSANIVVEAAKTEKVTWILQLTSS
jgi:hypothetical protein